MTPSLTISGIPFYDAPSEIEGSPYWVDLWTDINGYKIGLQVKPSTYKSASISIYMGKARSSEEKGYKKFLRDFGGKVFIVMPVNGVVSKEIEKKIVAERNLLLKLPPKK
ncbi:hypothetical protein [Caproiciproducens sp. CPB-2]|uniref:hypothetical protein n=1 Tax=Caproiciproducens sp. CPB-2 TaxID=3030017 RepID=UPI0023DA75A0|nr:hypothetical protein [Caproiciproducens sp. CPB-2]MDF1495696.1 hypothetical protein [Caproiciproducens sp. CPB-2]